MADDYDSRIQEAIDFLKFANDADTMNRQEALEDLKFGAGDQWPVELQNSRNLESRPVITVNKVDNYCRQVSNQQRQQRPRIKVHATNTHEDMVDAQTISGIIRHIEVNSNADHAYDNAFEYAVRMGWGYMRVRTDYISEDSFDQEEDIRLAEYYYTVREKATLYLLSDGSATFADDKDFFKRLDAYGITVIDKRDSFKKTIKYCKMTAVEVLEERDWAGKYIPIVPVYGRHIVIGDKRKKFGMIRYAKDPQRMYNFWQTSITEGVALAPKAKWLLAEGQDEGHENDWSNANIKSFPLLRYKQTDIDGRPAPAPVRLQPEPPQAGIMAAAMGVDNDIKAIMGVFDPAQLGQGNISGKALNGQQQQVDLTNFDYYDNLTRSIAHVGKICLDLIPKIYDTERVMRIIGDDGKPELLTINQRDSVDHVLNDISVGQYDVVMETGPGYNSKRQEAVDNMLPLLSAAPELMQVAGDLVFRNMDWPGADIIADRLAASNPMAQIDDKSKVPPQVQMQLAMSQKQIQELTQALQARDLLLKNRMDVEQMKQDSETKRTLMKETGRANEAELREQSDRVEMQMRVEGQANDTVINSQTKLEIERMKQQIAILLATMHKETLHNASAETTERAI